MENRLQGNDGRSQDTYQEVTALTHTRASNSGLNQSGSSGSDAQWILDEFQKKRDRVYPRTGDGR